MWVYCLLVLCLKEGETLFPSLLPSFLTPHFHNPLHPWTFSANFLVLRLLSFHFDVRWVKRGVIEPFTFSKAPSRSFEPLSYYQTLLPPPSSPSLLSFFSYMFFAPFYLAGPILPFSSFYRQMCLLEMNSHKGQTLLSSTHLSHLIQYSLRLGLMLVGMELATRHLPYFAIMYSGSYNHIPPHLVIFNLSFYNILTLVCCLCLFSPKTHVVFYLLSI